MSVPRDNLSALATRVFFLNIDSDKRDGAAISICTTEMCDRLRRLCYTVKYFFGNDRQNDRHMRHNNFLQKFFLKKIKA